MFKQIILFLSLIQLMQCFSTRSNIWWSRRNDDISKDCDIEFTNENPSLEAKICGYCFAKCQQQLADCLLIQMQTGATDTPDYCQEKSVKCEKRCFNDKRTSRIAQANWAKVVRILQQFHSYTPLGVVEEEKKSQ